MATKRSREAARTDDHSIDRLMADQSSHVYGGSSAWVVLIFIGLMLERSFVFAVDRGAWVERTWVVMGTYLTIRAYIPKGHHPDRILETVVAVAREDERRFSLFRNDSEVWKVIREAPRHPVRVSPPFLRLILHARRAAEISRGAFDITTGALSMAWGFIPGPPHFPDMKHLRRAMAQVGWDGIVINEKHSTVFFRRSGMVLDFGGDAKGFSVDRMVELLRKTGVRHALVNLGGEIYAMGFEDARRQPWKIDIRSPDGSSRVMDSFRVHDMAVSTSGSYERYFEVKGHRYSHILSPFTGYPVETNLLSVTVVTHRAVDADTYSTALFIQGPSGEESIRKAIPCLYVSYIEKSGGGKGRVFRGSRWPPEKCEEG